MMRMGKYGEKMLFAAGIPEMLTVPVWAGGYHPLPDAGASAFPESDGNAGVVALVIFGVVFVVGIVRIATGKWRDRGDGDKG